MNSRSSTTSGCSTPSSSSRMLNSPDIPTRRCCLRTSNSQIVTTVSCRKNTNQRLPKAILKGVAVVEKNSLICFAASPLQVCNAIKRICHLTARVHSLENAQGSLVEIQRSRKISHEISAPSEIVEDLGHMRMFRPKESLPD